MGDCANCRPNATTAVGQDEVGFIGDGMYPIVPDAGLGNGDEFAWGILNDTVIMLNGVNSIIGL